ncbi:MAG: serine hydrolase [Pseudomonadota bacterium]
MAIDQNNPARCGLAWAAKVVASGVFVTGRDPKDVFTLSCSWMAAPDHVMKEALETKNPRLLLELPVEIDVDRDAESVRLTLNGETAYARRFGDQGCVILDHPDATPAFEPTPVVRSPITDDFEPIYAPEPGDAGATGLDADAVNDAVEHAFANPMEFTNALVVAHKGKIVVERYRDPFERRTQFESWSMGKSVAASLVGVAERTGGVRLDDDDLFDRWRERADDPRRSIRVRDILNMASGLEFSGSFGKDEDHSIKSENGRFLDHIYVYGGGVDSVDFCLGKPLADPPGTAGRYRNCDPLLATAIVRERMAQGDVQAFLNWPQANLYDRIGSDGMLLETDPFGHFLISGHDYGRAMDWARLGQLYLQRGAWGDRQILNETFVDFVQTPAAEAWRHNPYYGGFFCTNATGLLPGSPPDAFWMSGGGLQRVVVIPSCDLVIVRLGHMAGLIFGVERTLNDVIARLAQAAQGT